MFVTTTSKLLNYYVHHKYMFWHHKEKDDSLFIMIDSITNEVEGTFIPTAEHLAGITFYIPDDKNIIVMISGEPVTFQINAHDETGRISVSTPWQQLVFPEEL